MLQCGFSNVRSGWAKILTHGSDAFSVLCWKKEINLEAGSWIKLMTQCSNMFAQNKAIIFHLTAVWERLTACRTLCWETEGTPKWRHSRTFLDKVTNLLEGMSQVQRRHNIRLLAGRVHEDFTEEGAIKPCFEGSLHFSRQRWEKAIPRGKTNVWAGSALGKLRGGKWNSK